MNVYLATFFASLIHFSYYLKLVLDSWDGQNTSGYNWKFITSTAWRCITFNFEGIRLMIIIFSDAETIVVVACRLLAVDNNILFAKFKQTRCSLNLLVFHIRFFFNPWTFRCPNLRCVCCYPIFPFKIVVRFKLDNIVIVKSNIFCSASTLGFVGSLCSPIL